MSAAAAAPAAATSTRHLERLLHRSIGSLRHILPPRSRLAALDITPTHVSLSVCDRDRVTAAPFGTLARTASPRADALILSSALRRAAEHDPAGTLDVHGLVVGVPPENNLAHVVVAYAQELIEAELHGEGEGEREGEREKSFLPGLAGVLFYSEVHAVRRAVCAQEDYMRAVEQLPKGLSSPRRKRFAAAMSPEVGAEELVKKEESRARVSASEILQAVLEEMKREAAR